MLYATAQFLAEYPIVSQISIAFDLKKPRDNDNIMHIIKGLIPVIKQALGPETNEQEAKYLAIQLVATIQNMFLRASVYKSYIGLDFFNAKQREKCITNIVNNLISTRRSKGE